MRAVVLNGPNDFAPTELPKPEIGDNEILLEMKKAAICGTDMRILQGPRQRVYVIHPLSAMRCVESLRGGEERIRI